MSRTLYFNGYFHDFLSLCKRYEILSIVDSIDVGNEAICGGKISSKASSIIRAHKGQLLLSTYMKRREKSNGKFC